MAELLTDTGKIYWGGGIFRLGCNHSRTDLRFTAGLWRVVLAAKGEVILNLPISHPANRLSGNCSDARNKKRRDSTSRPPRYDGSFK